MKLQIYILSLLLSFAAQAQSQIVWQAALTITKTGTYTGNYKSTDSNIPAITVNCYEPVEITGCNVTGAGELIHASGGTKLNIHHNNLTGSTPTGNNQWGRVADVYHPQTFQFENNTVDHTGGIRIDHADENTKQVFIRRNIFKNTDKRRVDNSEGDHRAGILLDGVVGVDGEIAWNYFENEVNNSWIEDNINLRNSGGTKDKAFQIHDNYIKGAYPAPFDYNTSRNTNYTGSGITVEGDPGTTDFNKVAQYTHIYNNQVISTMNGGINVNHGHDHIVENNTIISSGMIPTGQYSKSFWGGGAIWNGSNLSPDVFNNIVYQNNTVGYYRKDVSVGGTDRQDWVIVNGSPISVDPSKNISLPNPITLATEEAELPKWKAKTKNIAVGNVAGTPGPGTTPSDLTYKIGQVVTGKITPINKDGKQTTFKSKTVKVNSSASTKISAVLSVADETTFTLTPKAAGISTVTVSFSSNSGKVITKKYVVAVTAADDADDAVGMEVVFSVK
jgi:hypothetical protein